MNVAIIVAAGQGSRAGGERAKQFQELSGIPIIVHTLRRFERCPAIDRVVVVAPPNAIEDTRFLVDTHQLAKVDRVVSGGATRMNSVWEGLKVLGAAPADIVAIHDGVRPFVTSEQIGRVVAEAARTGAAILATPVVDTVKESEGPYVRQTLDRTKLWRAQTPQCFRYDLVSRAYAAAIESVADATDDSSLVEQLGASVSIVEGSPYNIKITSPQDFAFAALLLESERTLGSQ